MLKFVNIVNLAVIHKLNVELQPGLCVLTGETGAGKSIIVDALGLLLGRRGGAELIRTGARMALVEGVFEVGGGSKPRVEEILEAVGLGSGEADELIIRKELHDSGRKTARDVVTHVVQVRELDGLLAIFLGTRHVRRASNGHCEAEQSPHEEENADNTDLREGVGAAMEDLRHRMLKPARPQGGRLLVFRNGAPGGWVSNGDPSNGSVISPL